jgi:hypothetical protein
MYPENTTTDPKNGAIEAMEIIKNKSLSSFKKGATISNHMKNNK